MISLRDIRYFSWTDADAKFGVSLTASMQKRDSSTAVHLSTNGAQQHTMEQFHKQLMTLLLRTPLLWASIIQCHLIFAMQLRTAKERTNLQLTLQYSPVESLTAHLIIPIRNRLI